MANPNGQSGGVFSLFNRKPAGGNNQNPNLNQQVNQNGQNNSNNNQNGQNGQPAPSGANNPNNSRLQNQPLDNDARNSPSGNTSTDDDPDGQNNQQQNQSPTNPLDAFDKLWQNDPNAVKAGPQPLFKPDVGKLQEAIGKINFAESLSPELVTKALDGDAASFTQAINSVAQQSFGKAILASSQMMEKAFEKRMADVTKNIDERVKSISTREGLRRENPAFSHRAVAPLLDSIQTQLQTKYPEATSDELRQHAMTYLSGIAQMVTKSTTSGQQDEEEAAPKPDENAKNTDWSSFFQ